MQHTVNLGQIVASDPAPYHLTGNTWSIPDLSASQSGYAFAQTPGTSLTAGAFVTTWRTTTADESITLPISGSDMTVNWGDGSTSTGVSAPVDHTYNTAGNYTIQVTGGLERLHRNDAADASKLVSLDQWGNTTWTTMENAFYGANNMAYNAADSPDLSTVTSMSNMFRDASSFNGDLSNWDVSSVTDMFGMFRSATSFNQPLNSWDVSSVTDMGAMFWSATAFDQDLANWYVVQDLPPVLTANATLSIRAQNSYLDGLVSTYSINDTRFVMDGKILSLNSTNLPPTGMYPLNITAPAVLGEPNASTHTRTVTITVSDLTAGAFVTTWKTTSADQSITINFVGDDMNISWGDDGTTETNLSGPQTHTYPKAGNYTVSVTGGLTGLTLDRPKDFLGFPGFVPELASIDQWGGISWTNMSNAFAGATNMVYNAGDAPDLSGVTDMSFMFGGATSFDGDLSSWDVSSVTNMNGMFNSASSFNQPLNSWNVSSVTDMTNMFIGASSFSQPLNSWDVSSVIYMSSMFFNAISFDGTLSDWNVSSVIYMSSMFFDAEAFNQPLNTWDVSSATSMEYMFKEATAFNQPLNAWDVSSVTDMSGMFEGATSFNQPLNRWNVSSVIGVGMIFMFHNADDFDQNLGNWYVVANATSIARADVPRVVAEISAQNDHLNGHNPTYGISSDNDYAFFEIVNDNKINMTSVGTKSSYRVNVTASGSNVFESGNNWRLLEIKVTGQTTDATPPVIKLEGSSLVTITVDDTYTEEGAVCDDDVDADKPATVGGDTVDTSTAGQYTVTYDCTDTSNNEATQVSRTVNVQSAPDTDAPVIIITGLTNIQLTVDETYTEQGATCEDNVDADKPATVGGDTVDTSTAGQYTVTYDCTDTSNNEATQVSRTVNVQSAPDTDAPVIIITGSANIQLTVDETYTEQGATCEDNVDADKPATVGGDTVDTSTAGQYTVTYDCTDTSNNEATQVSRTVNVQSAPDTDAPVIIITGLTNIQLTVDETYTEQGATCEDNVDADKPATVGGDTVDTSTAGQYTVTYDCTDTSNNEATQVSRTVNVQSAPDTDAPVIIITGSANIQLTVDETYTEQGATCEDNVDADKPATVGGDTVDTSTAGQYTVTYDCTDTSNNEATQVSRTVTVIETGAPFITTWRTDSANQTITIPVGGSTARYSIDWGDNSPAGTDITGDSTHIYREADSYTVSISGGLERFHLDGLQPNAGRLISIDQWGDTRWTTMDAAFDGATNMVYRATDTPDLSGVTDMHRMFGDATAFNGDLSSWDVSAVTDMSSMFYNADSFNGDLSSWDVSAVTDMSSMFYNADSFNGDLSSWDVSAVTDMSSMFYNADSFNGDLSSWDVSAVTDSPACSTTSSPSTATSPPGTSRQ